MKREEIKILNAKLKQIEKLECMYKEINGEGANHWWRIKTPYQEISISDNETRLRFKEFIESEIEALKKEISLEDQYKNKTELKVNLLYTNKKGASEGILINNIPKPDINGYCEIELSKDNIIKLVNTFSKILNKEGDL